MTTSLAGAVVSIGTAAAANRIELQSYEYFGEALRPNRLHRP